MTKEIKVDLFQVNDHEWITLSLFNSRTFSVVRTLDGRYYIWAQEVMRRKTLLGVVETFEQARSHIKSTIRVEEEEKEKKEEHLKQMSIFEEETLTND